MQAPAGVAPSSTFKSPITQISYAIDAQGFVTVNSLIDTVVLSLMGFQKLPGGRNNLIAVTDPTTSDDSSLDYAAFSAWINQAATNNSGTVPRAWLCADASVGAAKWFQISIGSSTPGTAEFTHLILDGLLTGSCTQVTAFSGGGQASATQLTTIVNNIITATSSSEPYDSSKLPAATPGRLAWGINSAANPVRMFGLGSDTINAFGASTGFMQPVGSIVPYVCRDTGKWSAINFGMGFTTYAAYNTNSATSSATLTGANISGGIADVTLELTGTLSAAGTATLPTVANLVAAIPNPVAGQAYTLRVMNSSAGDFTWTVATNTGWTLNGTMTIDAGGWRDFQVTLTTLAAAVLRSIGASAPVAGMGFATNFAFKTNSATTDATLTGTNISGGEVETTLALTGTMSGDSNATLPTVANLVAAIPDPVAGQSYKLRIVNESSASHVWTVLTGTGWTLAGTMTINQGASRSFYVTFTTLSAAVLQSIDA
jgi:hypothetical protein